MLSGKGGFFEGQVDSFSRLPPPFSPHFESKKGSRIEVGYLGTGIVSAFIAKEGLDWICK